MENNLPEWFNHDEFENFLAEGVFTRQAWVKTVRRWRETKNRLRKMIGNTPMKNMKDAMMSRNAIMARTAIQNARDIQTAQNREQSMKRNYAEETNLEGNILNERLNSGSSRTFFSLGNKESAGSEARAKAPFGNEKKFARLKKRIQRKRMKARGMKVENFNFDFLEEADKKVDSKNKDKNKKTPDRRRKNTKNPNEKTPTEMAEKGDFSDIVVVEVNGKTKIESWNSVKSKKNIKFIKKRGQIRNKSDLDPFTREKLKDKFSWTETYSKIFPGDKEPTKADKADKKERKKTAPKQKKEQKAATASTGETKEKPTSTPKKRSFGKELLPPERRVAPNKLSSSENKKSAELAQFIGDKEAIQKLAKNGFFGKDDKALEEYQLQSDSNPWISEVGTKNLPKIMSFAINNKEELQGKELFLLSLDGRQNCFSFSKKFKNLNAIDRVSKGDYIVFPKDKLDQFAKYLSTESQECEEMKRELVEESMTISHKAGKSKLASSYATDTLAMIDEIKTLLMSVEKEFPPELYKLIDNFNRLKSLSDGSNMFKTISSVVSPQELENMTPEVISKLDAQRQSNQIAAQQYFAISTPIVNDIKKITNELLENDIIKAAFVYAYASENGKFENNSLGKVDGFIFADNNGEHVGSMTIPPTFKDALEDRRFMSFVKRHRMNVRGNNNARKPLAISSGGRGLDVFSQKPGTLTASYDPLMDNELDQLFEYSFLPPDTVIDTMAPESSLGMPGAEATLSGPAGFSNQNSAKDFSFTSQNILTTLNRLGIIENVDFDVVDYTDVGMELSSLQSPITNLIVVNGREYTVPVFNVDLDEDIFNEYDALNEVAVQMIKDGIPYEGVVSIFEQELPLLLEKKKRNYKREYAIFHGKAEQRQKRSKRVLARRKMAKRLGKNKIKGKDIDHKDGNAMNNSDSNLRVRSVKSNRADNKKSKRSITEKINWWDNLEGCPRATKKRLMLTPGQWDKIDPVLKKLLTKEKGTCR